MSSNFLQRFHGVAEHMIAPHGSHMCSSSAKLLLLLLVVLHVVLLIAEDAVVFVHVRPLLPHPSKSRKRYTFFTLSR